MSGITNTLHDLYIRFLVWLGAEPPEGYENLLQAEEVGPWAYTLKEDDTLFAVARRFGVHYDIIAKANAIEDPASVKPGQTITIPPANWNPETDAPLVQPPPEGEPTTAPEVAETPPTAPSAAEEIEPLPEAETKTVTDETGVKSETSPQVEEIEAEEAAETPVEPVAPEGEPEALSPAAQAPLIEAEEAPWPVETETPSVESSLETETPVSDEDQEMVFRYEIQRGDTLNAIARRYGITVKALIETNNIADPNRIYPGQKLVIPGYDRLPQPEAESEEVEAQLKPQPPSDQFITHIVAKGDTLSGIAKRYGITLRQLVEVNNIEDPSGSLRVGQHLLIPGGIQPPEVEPEPEPKPETIGPPPTPEPEPSPRVAPEPTVEIDPTFPPLGPLQATRALYVSYFAIGHDETRQRIFDLLGTTELNALVIDVKGDHGLISHPTNNPTAREIGADRHAAKDFNEVMAHMKEHGIYTIARIVTFKDNLLAKGYPDLAVETPDNRIWQDHEQSGWADPFLKPVWDYNIQIAIDAARLGFDEIQFDYLRFPFASQVGEPQFSQEVSKETRIAAITGFLSIARGQLQPLGVKIGAKTFGYTCWRKDDSLIGQDIESMAEYLDILSPMLAPSTFGSGIPGYKFAIAHPYELVHESAKRAVERVSRFDCLVRPWIQDFPDYRFDKRVYGREEIQAQIKGCFDAGSVGFMVWSPKVQYTENAYAPMQMMP